MGSSPVTPTSRKVRKWRRYAVCGLFLFAWSLSGTCQKRAQDTIRTLPDTVLGNECGREASPARFFVALAHAVMSMTLSFFGSSILVSTSSYAFGQRHNISTKVGAVLILDDEQADRYLYFAGERHYGINILCTFEEFRAWGLPNKNLTDMSIKVDYDTASIKEADESWFSAISNAKGMTFSSTSDITEKVVTGTRRTMSVYYCMMAVLIPIMLSKLKVQDIKLFF